MTVNDMKQTIIQVAENLTSNPKAVHLVATTTAGLGAADALELVKSGLSIVAVTIGIALSILMLVKNSHDLRVAKARRAEEILEREARGLPVRRDTDKQLTESDD